MLLNQINEKNFLVPISDIFQIIVFSKTRIQIFRMFIRKKNYATKLDK